MINYLLDGYIEEGTEEEKIMKGLNHCMMLTSVEGCNECPYEKLGGDCKTGLNYDCIKLFKRYRLQQIRLSLFDSLNEEINEKDFELIIKAKRQAVKEFCMRVREKPMSHTMFSDDSCVDFEDIEEIASEMIKKTL